MQNLDELNPVESDILDSMNARADMNKADDSGGKKQPEPVQVSRVPKKPSSTDIIDKCNHVLQSTKPSDLPKAVEGSDLLDDANYVRAQLYRMMEKGTEGIDSMLELARESESPRAYEVLATLLKNMSEVSDRFLDLQRKRQEIIQKENDYNGNKPEESSGGTTNNNLFVGTTSDLLEMLDNIKKKHDDAE